MFINKASELIEESSSLLTQSRFRKCSASLAVNFLEPSFPLRPAQKRPVAGRNEIAVLRSAWRRLINDDWHLAVTGHM